MTKKHCFKVDKLVRDKLPDILRAKGIDFFGNVMEQNEYLKRLKDKLIEEAHEVVEAKNKQEIQEELADVLEVIYALCLAHDFSFEAVEKARIRKREIKGGFEGRVYNSFIEMEPANPHIHYYAGKHDKYPEIEHDRNS